MKIKHFTKNTEGTDFVVGDIHGCFGKLKVVLAEIGFDGSKDRLFSTGDLVDRGPDSEASLEWLSKPWFHAVRGNHEQMAIDFCKGLWDVGTYIYNGGAWFIGLDEGTRSEYVAAFSELPIAIDIRCGNTLFGIIHAECPGDSWDQLQISLEANEHACDMAMWSRSKFNSKDTTITEGVDKVFVGHTPVKSVSNLGNTFYIDTGAVFGGQISVLKIH